MNTQDTMYKNGYFNFCVDLSVGWRFKGTDLLVEHNQQDDLPKKEGDYKTLLFASYQPKTSLISKCSFSISVHRISGYFDLLEFSKKKIDVIDLQSCSKKFLGCDSQEITIKQLSDNRELITKVVFWSEAPQIWIGAVAEGSSPENFHISESLFSKIHRIK